MELRDGTVVRTSLDVGISHAMHRAMTDERLILAIGRLERALARVESHVLQFNAASPDLKLAQANEMLRATLADAIRRIDTLIGPTTAGA